MSPLRGGGDASIPRCWRIYVLTASQRCSDGRDMLVKISGAPCTSGGDPVERGLANLSGQPQADSRQRDRRYRQGKVWHVAIVLTGSYLE